MVQNRTLHELAEILLKPDNLEYFTSGLCHYILELNIRGKITKSEYCMLKRLIVNNKPFTTQLTRLISNPDLLNPSSNNYYWRYGKVEPRIKWIKKHMLNK